MTGGPSLSELETPCILIDRAIMRRNLHRVRTIAQRAGLALRPHVKTHKSIELARLQLDEGGAVGICTSKMDEALVFISAGFRDVTIAYPIIDVRKLRRLIDAAARSGSVLHLIADSTAGIDSLAAASQTAPTPLDVYLKVDVGLGRAGVDPRSDKASDLTRRIAGQRGLTFAGLLSHAGHAYAAANPAAVAAIAEAERSTMLALRKRLEQQGLRVPNLSIGSTPTVLASERFDGIGEIRPGNYIFLDRTAVRLGIAKEDDIALSVLATVVSRNDRYLIVDAGSKVLSSDLGAHSVGGGEGYGIAYPMIDGFPHTGLSVARLSEEHGWIAHNRSDLPIGSRMRIMPNHSCVVANLLNEAWLVEDEQVINSVKINARGCVL